MPDLLERKCSVRIVQHQRVALERRDGEVLSFSAVRSYLRRILR